MKFVLLFTCLRAHPAVSIYSFLISTFFNLCKTLMTFCGRRSGSFLLEEKHWLPVQIEGAFPNQAPKSSFSNMYILEVIFVA